MNKVPGFNVIYGTVQGIHTAHFDSFHQAAIWAMKKQGRIERATADADPRLEGAIYTVVRSGPDGITRHNTADPELAKFCLWGDSYMVVEPAREAKCTEPAVPVVDPWRDAAQWGGLPPEGAEPERPCGWYIFSTVEFTPHASAQILVKRLAELRKAVKDATTLTWSVCGSELDRLHNDIRALRIEIRRIELELYGPRCAG